MTDDEYNPFPSDQITSDPTFFDDFMSQESPESLPSTPRSLNTTPPTSPVGNPDGYGIYLEHAESNPSPRSCAASGPSKSKVMDKIDEIGLDVQAPQRPNPRSTNQASQANKIWSLPPSPPKRRKSTAASTRNLSMGARETQDPTGMEVGSKWSGRANEEHRVNETNAIALQVSSPALEVQPRAGVEASTTTPQETETKNHEGSEAFGSIDAASSQPSRPIPRKVNSAETIYVNDRTPFTTSITSIDVSGSNVSKPSKSQSVLIRPHRPKRSPATTAEKPSSHSTSSNSTNTLQFDIIEPPPDHAYVVKHKRERRSEIGSKWSEADQKAAFHIIIAKHARVRYVIGDIVNVDFPQGQGGSAKIIEIRLTDMLLIVVQWLYSRSDAVRSGGVVPRVGHWPRNMYMLSDHFQVVCDENINGRSNATPIADVYWAATSRRMRPSGELEQKLKMLRE